MHFHSGEIMIATGNNKRVEEWRIGRKKSSVGVNQALKVRSLAAIVSRWGKTSKENPSSHLPRLVSLGNPA